MQGDTQGVPEGWIVTAQAAEILGITVSHLYMMCLRGYIRHCRIGPPRGGIRLYNEEEIRAYKADHPALGTGRRLKQAI